MTTQALLPAARVRDASRRAVKWIRNRRREMKSEMIDERQGFFIKRHPERIWKKIPEEQREIVNQFLAHDEAVCLRLGNLANAAMEYGEVNTIEVSSEDFVYINTFYRSK